MTVMSDEQSQIPMRVLVKTKGVNQVLRATFIDDISLSPPSLLQNIFQSGAAV